MSILKRPPGDMFTFRLFFKLISKLKVPHDKFYLWSVCIDPNYRQITHFLGEQEFYEDEILYRNTIMKSVKTDLIVMGIKDHLTGNEFNPNVSEYTDMTLWLKQMAQYYSDKKIILFTSLENLKINEPNVTIIPWGGDITNHQKEYQKLTPVLEKNLDSNHTFLSLNRNKRSHRAMLVSLLYGLDIQDFGLISCMFKDNIEDLFSYTEWKTKSDDIYLTGFSKLKDSDLSINDSLEIYHNNNNDNVSNFKNSLKTYYKNTFVEIISETSYTEPCYNLTEKTLNSIYGCCFPILLCSKGSVNFLRSMGVDMFDDIIDHSYDTIEDPAERLEAAIKNNIDLLTNNKRTKELWIKNKDRFENNVAFCRERLYNYYSDRSIKLFSEVISNEL